MCSERKRLSEQIKSIELKLDKFPKGSLVCKKNKNRYKWYHSIDGKQIHISKSKKQLAESLAAKKYLMHVYEDLLHEKNAIEFYLRHHKESKADEMLTDKPEYQELLSPYFKPRSQELDQWMNSPYEKNEKYSNNLIHKTASGNLVRSKSEALIEMLLIKHHIPFRYECALQLGDTTFYPDFTIRHPQTGEEFYWEHFGKMDDEKYAKSTGGKLQMYIANGIVPGVQLITTYETKDKPLSEETVENVIREYFM